MSTLLTIESGMRFETAPARQNAPRNNTQGGVQNAMPKSQGAIANGAPSGKISMEGTEKTGDSPSAQQGGGKIRSLRHSFDRNECRTCKTRRYMDGSNDPGVSFKSPTSISPGASAGAVAAHENEHVTRNKAKAEEEGREVVSQTVILHTATCPECGVVYTAGGETTTVTRAKSKEQQQIDVTA
ncbi:MAG: hypothetical protein RSE24_05345 [Oscillospiraceae bacterium]